MTHFCMRGSTTLKYFHKTNNAYFIFPLLERYIQNILKFIFYLINRQGRCKQDTLVCIPFVIILQMVLFLKKYSEIVYHLIK